MGSKTDGSIATHLKSKCCNEIVRWNINHTTLYAWCEKCGKYIHTTPVQGLIALHMGDFKAVKAWDGYLPKWLSELIIQKDFLLQENSNMKEIIEENTKLKEGIKNLMKRYDSDDLTYIDLQKIVKGVENA